MLHRGTPHECVDVGAVLVDECGQRQFAHGTRDALDSQTHARHGRLQRHLERGSEARHASLALQIIVLQARLHLILWQTFFCGRRRDWCCAARICGLLRCIDVLHRLLFPTFRLGGLCGWRLSEVLDWTWLGGVVGVALS